MVCSFCSKVPSAPPHASARGGPKCRPLRLVGVCGRAVDGGKDTTRQHEEICTRCRIIVSGYHGQGPRQHLPPQPLAIPGTCRNSSHGLVTGWTARRVDPKAFGDGSQYCFRCFNFHIYKKNIQNMAHAAAGFNRAYFDRGAIRSVSLYNRAWYQRVHLSTIWYRSQAPPNNSDIHTQITG